MYIFFERVAATNVVQTAAVGLTPPIPNIATFAEVQADWLNVRYTMDDITDPTEDSGMLFRLTDPPKLFLIEDLLRMRWIRGVAQGVGGLNIHYGNGRGI